MIVLLLFAFTGAAHAADCPPLMWELAHPNDCRDVQTGATVIGACCDWLLVAAATPPIPTDAECVDPMKRYGVDCLLRSVRRGVRKP